MYIGKHLELLSKSFDGDKKKFVQRHQSIFDVVEDLRQFIKPILFIQFLTCSLKLCVNIFKVLQSGYLFQQFGITAIIFVQLLEYCYAGQFILDRSLKVGEQFNTTDKDFVIIIARTQKQLVVKAGFYSANLAFVTFVLNSTFSMLAVFSNLAF